MNSNEMLTKRWSIAPDARGLNCLPDDAAAGRRQNDVDLILDIVPCFIMYDVDHTHCRDKRLRLGGLGQVENESFGFVHLAYPTHVA
jgi:hypothetical protein